MKFPIVLLYKQTKNSVQYMYIGKYEGIILTTDLMLIEY